MTHSGTGRSAAPGGAPDLSANGLHALSPRAGLDLLFPGDSEMARRCRTLDWAATALGPIERWPAALRTVVPLVLAAGLPNIVLWGADLIQIYNDSYARIIGAKHPLALGRRNRDVWPEVWHLNGPIYRRVFAGETVTLEDALYPLGRQATGARPDAVTAAATADGHEDGVWTVEDVYLTIGFSPIRDETGAVAGVLAHMLETTGRVRERQVAEGARADAHRQQYLRRLDEALRPLADPAAVKAAATRVLAEHLGVQRAYYVDVAPDDAHVVCEADYTRDDAPSAVGRYPLAAYGPTLAAEYRAGRAVVIADTRDDPLVPAALQAAWEAIGIRAQLAVPLVKAGRFTAALGVDQGVPRAWTPEDVALVRETAERTWASVERAGAEAALRAGEAARRASEARLRTVVLQTPAPLALLEASPPDGALRFALVNHAYRRVSGGGRDVTGLTPAEAFPELAGSGIHERFDRVYATGEPWDSPETLVRYDRDGIGVMDTWFNLRLEPVRDDGGRVTGVFNFAVDVTEQVRARHEVERSLAESERARAESERVRREAEVARTRSDAVLASIADAFYLLDRDWRFTFVNDAAEPLLQTTRAQLLGRTLWDAFPDVAGSPFEGPYREAMATGRVTSVEAEFAPLGTWFDVRSYPWPGGLMVHFRDVGARKVAEAERERLLVELQAANAELRRLTAEAQEAERRSRFLAELGQALQPVVEPDAVMETTARLLGEHLGVDRCAYAEVEADEDAFTITGNYTRGDTASIIGRFTFRAFGEEVLRLMRANAAYVVEDAGADARVTPPDRVAYEATQIRAVICVPLHKAGRLVAAMAVHQRVPRAWTPDEVELVVTVVQRCWEALARARALRRLQEREAALRATSAQLAERTAAAEAAQREAEEANRAKTAFLSVMSHELRTPLNAIGGYAELLALGVRGPVTEAQRADLERLLRANQHMAGLVTTVLDFARIEAGQVEYHLEAVPLGPVVRDLEALVAPSVAAKGLTYDHDGCGLETPERPRVVQADPEKLRQILLNLLTNAVKFTDPPGGVALRCDTDPATRVVRVRVSDTGRGIPADQRARIFEPFVQVDRHRTQASQQGVGLGLAISRDLARGMGGDLTVESTLGVGSTFTLTLPMA